ncbi:1,4-dihydroxy-2-naphthoate prenyltransferase, partial [Streptococcus suis]|nr:1,4-dihydroxy-2-naphthoate prenyltransferase [Streptococcus suis]
SQERLFSRHLVSLLLLRRMRKLCFLISNFKHSTGVFELALPD